VGSIRQFLKEFKSAARRLPVKVASPRQLTWVVGNAVEHAFQPIVKRLNQVEGLQVKMAALKSEYWGQQISVTGLITGQDILRTLKGEDLGAGILLPSLMLKHDDARFLDDMTVDELAQQLDTQIWQISSIEELLETCVVPG